MSDSKTRVLSLKRDGDATPGKTTEERLHKVLAQAGLGSRRALEERIGQGLVKVNGEVAQVGQSVRSGDRIELDGKAFMATALTDPARVLVYHKPEGEVTTREDPEGRPTVFDKLPRIKGARWINIGRLDINTTGLLMLTTDGELANALMHPSREVEREYVCRIHGEVSDEVVRTLGRGVELDDGPAKFKEIESIGSSDSHAWFKVVIEEGRNREVRRLWESQGFQVSRLKRVRYGSTTLPRLLKRGESEEMPAEDVLRLQKSLDLDTQPTGLTLHQVIGQRRARSEVKVSQEDRQAGYVAGHTMDEARELRVFDNLRDERPARRGRPAGPGRGRPAGGKPGGARPGGGKPRGAGGGPRGPGGPGGNRAPRRDGPAPGFDPSSGEFRSWYVPEGVETGPSGHRNPGAPGAPRGPRGPGKPRGAGGPGAPGGKPRGPGGNRPAGKARGPGGPGGKPRGPGGPGGGKPRGGGNRGPRSGGGGGGNR